MIDKMVEGISKLTTKSQDITPDICFLQFTIVNACIIGIPQAHSGEWVLVDTGLKNSIDYIKETVEKRFGKDNPPGCIILTHGHFDHVGSVIKLAEYWDVPVFCHELEIPYITGKKDYPMADSSVDEGLVAKMSPAFPHKGIDLGYRAATLPSDGSVPGMPEWKWVHTPGHTEGHISLFREKDGVLIVGDAFTTTKQESLSSVLTQKEKIKGPPAYLTTDWKAAEKSVKQLKELNPSLVLPSHGLPLKGEKLDEHLEMLNNHFKEISVPEQGRFVE